MTLETAQANVTDLALYALYAYISGDRTDGRLMAKLKVSLEMLVAVGLVKTRAEAQTWLAAKGNQFSKIEWDTNDHFYITKRAG